MRRRSFVIALTLVLLASTGQAQAELKLREIMVALEARMEAVVRAINLDDFEAVESNSRQIDHNEKPPMEERLKIMGFLKEDASGFKETDGVVHLSALKMAEAAARKDYEGVVDNYRDVLNGCVR